MIGLPADISIEHVEVSACPEDSVRAFMKDGRTLQIEFEELVPYAGPLVSPLEGRKRCKVVLKPKIRDAYQFALVKIRSNFNLDMTENVRFDQTFKLSFDNQSGHETFKSEQLGPYANRLTYEESRYPQLWSLCGIPGDMTIDVTAQLRRTQIAQDPQATGFVWWEVTEPYAEFVFISRPCVPVG